METGNKEFAIELKDVSFKYNEGTPTEKLALSHVSYGFRKGRITGIMGHTGSGKSTLAMLLNGLEKCKSGKIYHNGVPIPESKKEIGKLRFEVGLVFQYPEYQLFEETVEADIAFGPKNMGITGDELNKRVKEAMDFVGLPSDVEKRSPFDLSGGQKRRVAIAGVLAMEPDTLILDEPAAGLDPEGREEILSGLVRYSREKNITMLIISHSMEDMAKFCDDLIVLKKGELMLSGTVHEVFSHTRELKEWGLAVPAITTLSEKLCEKGFDMDGVYTVDEAAKRILSMWGGAAK